VCCLVYINNNSWLFSCHLLSTNFVPVREGRKGKKKAGRKEAREEDVRGVKVNLGEVECEYDLGEGLAGSMLERPSNSWSSTHQAGVSVIDILQAAVSPPRYTGNLINFIS
jgi:hypothetical protein